MAFEGLTEKISSAFKHLRSKGRLTESDIKEAMREIRMALLEADVNFKVAKDFIKAVTEKATDAEILESLSPSQQVIKIVNEELVALLGGQTTRLTISPNPPTIVMMAGLQGAGKTTNCAKLAALLRKQQQRRPLLVACDVYRPAAIEQLKVVGRQLNIPVFDEGQGDPVEIAKHGIDYARRNGYDLVFLDTAGRLHIDEKLMDELKNIKATVKPTEIILVVDAMTGQDAVTVAQTFDEALGIDGVLIAEPVTGSSGQELALQLKKRRCMAVLLLAEPAHAASAAALLEQSGVLVLPNDAPEALIVQTIRLLAAVRIQLEQMQHETEKLEAKVADIRIINRAKLLLVQHLQMTETEAHKYIEKQAMDTSMRRRTIAENIIRTYED